jgi:hypothetical protein
MSPDTLPPSLGRYESQLRDAIHRDVKRSGGRSLRSARRTSPILAGAIGLAIVLAALALVVGVTLRTPRLRTHPAQRWHGHSGAP